MKAARSSIPGGPGGCAPLEHVTPPTRVAPLERDQGGADYLPGREANRLAGNRTRHVADTQQALATEQSASKRDPPLAPSHSQAVSIGRSPGSQTRDAVTLTSTATVTAISGLCAWDGSNS